MSDRLNLNGTYTQTNWKNNETALNAENLNNLEYGVSEALYWIETHKGIGDYSHIFNDPKNHNEGNFSIIEGEGNKGYGDHQHIFGKFNEIFYKDDSGTEIDTGEFNKYSLIVGNGANDFNRSNALTLDWNGNLTLSGKGTFKEGIKILTNSGATERLNIDKDNGVTIKGKITIDPISGSIFNINSDTKFTNNVSIQQQLTIGVDNPTTTITNNTINTDNINATSIKVTQTDTDPDSVVRFGSQTDTIDDNTFSGMVNTYTSHIGNSEDKLAQGTFNGLYNTVKIFLESKEGLTDAIDSLMEIQTYIKEHTAEASELTKAVGKLTDNFKWKSIVD